MRCSSDLHPATEEEQQELSKIHVFEHRLFPENRNSNPIVRKMEDGLKFYYSFWLAREKYRERPVFKKWQRLIQEATPVRFRLEPTDVLVVDNHRILHGRTAIHGERHLQRYWLH